MCVSCHHPYAVHDDPYTNDGCTVCECRHYETKNAARGK